VIEIGLVSVNAVFAAEAVNTLLDVYEKFSLKVGQSPGLSAYYRQELDKLDGEISTYENQLVQFKQSKGIADVEKERELVTLRRHAVQTDLDKLQLDKAGVKTDLDAKDRLIQTAFMRDDMSVTKLREQVFGREREVAELRSRSTDDNPMLKQK